MLRKIHHYIMKKLYRMAVAYTETPISYRRNHKKVLLDVLQAFCLIFGLISFLGYIFITFN